jgi:hypothetical protein
LACSSSTSATLERVELTPSILPELGAPGCPLNDTLRVVRR